MIKKIIMPQLGETMEEGTIERWLKKEGEKVEKGEPLLEITTDKATFEQESSASGFLRKILSPEKTTVPVTRTIAYLADSLEEEIPEEPPESREQRADLPAKAPASLAGGSAQAGGREQEAEILPKPESPQISGQVKVSPLAKKLAREKGIDLSQVKGSGPGGRIVEKDVLTFGQGLVGVKVTPLSKMRQLIAERLSQSKQTAPHYYLQVEIDLTEAVKLHQKEPQISYNDLIIKATALALKEFPLINSTFEEGKIKSFSDINIGIAVAREEGLVVPVIKQVDKKNLPQLAKEREELVKRAQAQKLSPQDISGGTFTISNLGMFGVDGFTAIINPPQVGILAVGQIKSTPVVKNGQIEICKLMKATLSLDHRVIDGAYGAQFLKRLKEILENLSPQAGLK